MSSPRHILTAERLRQRLAGMTSGGVLRSRMAAVAHLMSGSFGNALLMLAGLALATRALGVADFGTMVVVLTIGRVCERLVRFESWQPLVRFVADEEVQSDPQRLSRLYLFGLMLDTASALCGGLLAIAAAFVLADLFRFGEREIGLVAVYSIAIALNIRGMSSAIMRMAGQFGQLAYICFASSLLRLALALAAMLAGAGLEAFVVIWTAAQVLDALLFNVLGLRTLARQGVPSPLFASPRGLVREFPGFLAFAWTTNASTALRTLTHEADTLLVAALTGGSAAGFYHLAKRMAKTAQQAGEMIQTVLYPDLARMWARTTIRVFARTVLGVQLLMGLIAATALLVALPFGRELIGLAFGAQFDGAYPILITQLVAVFLLLHAAPARSGLLATNQPGYVLKVAAISTVLFLVVALTTIPQYGAIGASFAHIAFAGFSAVLFDAALWAKLRSTDAHAKAANERAASAPVLSDSARGAASREVGA